MRLASNMNNLAIKLNYTTPVYAHYDRIKYDRDGITYYKTILHIDTYIQDTNFDTSIVSAVVDGIAISQIADEKAIEIVLSDEPERLDVRNKISQITANYISELYDKTITVSPNNKLVCSQKIKLHEKLRPYSFETTIDAQQGGQNNE